MGFISVGFCSASASPFFFSAFPLLCSSLLPRPPIAGAMTVLGFWVSVTEMPIERLFL